MLSFYFVPAYSSLIVTIMLAAANASQASDSVLTATSIYSSMVVAMKTAAPPTRLQYNEVFEPHGLTISIEKKGTDEGVPKLVFSPQAKPVVFMVTQDGNQTTAVDQTTGGAYSGSKVFWAASWAQARSQQATVATTAPAVIVPSAEPSQSGSAVGFENARLDVIGNVTVSLDKFYDFQNAEPVTIDGTQTLHLHLRARSDVKEHPLTDLYIDPSTYMLKRADAVVTNEAGVSGYTAKLSLNFGSVQTDWMIVGGEITSSAHFLFSHSTGSANFHIENVKFLT